MTQTDNNGDAILASVYSLIWKAAVVLLAVAAVLVLLGESDRPLAFGDTPVLQSLVGAYLLLVPLATALFGVVMLARRQLWLGSVSLLLTIIWLALKLVRIG